MCAKRACSWMATRLQPAAAEAAAKRDGWTLGLELPPKLTISQWADAKRMIAQGTGPEPGRWRTDRTPYLREPMDSINDASVAVVVLMMSSQVGKSEVLVNAACYFIGNRLLLASNHQQVPLPSALAKFFNCLQPRRRLRQLPAARS